MLKVAVIEDDLPTSNQIRGWIEAARPGIRELIVTPERVIDCRSRTGTRPAAAIRWDDLTEEKIAAIPLLAAQRPAAR